MTTPNPLQPSLTLLCKLASIAAHAQELFSPTGHAYDSVALDAIANDEEVVQWLKQMGPLVPVKR